MKHARWHFIRRIYRDPETSADTGGAGGGVLNTMADAMAELDRREAARAAEKPAAAEAEESEEDAESSDEQSADDSAEDVATDDEDKEKPAEEDAPSLEEIEHEGKTYKVDPALKGAFLRQQDYTQKTQQVAEEKRQVDAAKQQTSAIASQLQQTQQALAYMAQNLIGQEPDLALAQQDPATYLVLQSQFRQRAEQFQQLQQHGQRLTQAQQEQQQAAQSDYRQREQQALLKAMPDLAKPEKFSEFRASALEVGSKYGISAPEIGEITDHRLILALRDLAKFHKQAAATGELKTKLANVPPKTAKPGAASTQAPAAARNADALRKFKQSGGSDRALREYLARTS